jgi:serine/threonine protein kinase
MSDSHEYAGFVAPDPADLAPLFPGYEIQGLIATGGMGAVYCAVQKSLDRTVAIKILPMELSKDAAFCAGFEAEAKAMARLNHPNLIGVFDFGEVNGMLYIVMEFVPGKSIYHSADGIAIDPGEVIRLVTGICHGLAHAHEHGIIHRDIKPSNILLDLNAQPKIGDFGLARPIERKIEEGEEIFGTPHYTAPEVVDAPHTVDYRADIFSVGVLLHELLTGKLPANDPRPASVIARCDVRFDAIIKRATQSLPAARYSSANEIAKELQVIAKSTASHGPRAAAVGGAVRGPVRPRRARFAIQKKKSSGGSSVFLLLLAIIVGGAAYWRFSQKPTVRVIVPPVEVADPKAPTGTDTEKPDAEPDEEPRESISLPPPVSPVTPQPDVTPDEATVPTRPDETTTSDSNTPKFDVDSFFERARKIMFERAKPSITAYEKKLETNVDSLGRDFVRIMRKNYYNRETAERILAKDLGSWKAAGNRIPAYMDETFTLASTPDAYKTFSDHLEKQAAIDQSFQREIAQLSPTYILGLEKQIERLKTDNDTAAIKLIEREITLTRDDPKYFHDLMMDSE